MTDTPNILKVSAASDRSISVVFENGIHSIFNFENYFSYTGYYAFLKDLNFFTNLKFRQGSNYIFWVNDSEEEIEIDSAILYAICTQEKIVVNEKVVFDPALGKSAWI